MRQRNQSCCALTWHEMDLGICGQRQHGQREVPRSLFAVCPRCNCGQGTGENGNIARNCPLSCDEPLFLSLCGLPALPLPLSHACVSQPCLSPLCPFSLPSCLLASPAPPLCPRLSSVCPPPDPTCSECSGSSDSRAAQRPRAMSAPSGARCYQSEILTKPLPFPLPC